MAEIIDGYGRRLNYVRISVTDRCNFRCTYCMPAEGAPHLDHSKIMRYEEIIFLCGVMHELGVGKFRFTGGEPLVRKGMVLFLKELKRKLPDVKTAITTNASLLSLYAGELAGSGIHSLNISLDTLDPVKFASITRIGKLGDVLDGIAAAKEAGIRNIKLNAVLIRGFNDTEIGALLAFSKKFALKLRLIEFMPLEDGVWDSDAFISGDEILKMLPCGDSWRQESSFDDRDGLGPARYYRNTKTGDVIGIITAVSNHFCKNCNRLRISAAGNLRTCLFSPVETPLRDMLLSGDGEGLKQAIIRAVRDKPRCWEDVRAGHQHMSGIGG